MTRTRTALAVGLCLLACSTPPKPRELDTFEKLRQSPQLQAAQQRSPGLVDDSEKLFKQAREEWESNNLDNSRRDALLGSIKLKTALALVEQDQARARTQAADADYRRTEDEYARVAKDLSAANEQIALLGKLQEARTSAQSEREKLSQEQQRARAQDKLAAAQLALKTADTVEASNYAADVYRSASDMVARADAEMKAGNFAAAETTADLAQKKAEQATQTAKPAYQQAEQTKQNKTRDEALGRDAAGISGVSVRLERRGDVARLVLPLRGLFVKKQTTVGPGHEPLLDQMAALLKKYPTYPVEIVGHTDSRGKHDELVALSQSRAQSVLEALVSRGAETKRFLVTGKGPDEPATDNKSSAGRAQNNRVEIVFLYQ
jgi:outer membrane protein OmpA-like peptidoglycan-associated protein